MEKTILLRSIAVMSQDANNDNKGIFWDGKEIAIVDDPLDNDTLYDGRGGEYAYTRLKTNVAGTVYSVDRKGLLNCENVLKDDAEIFESRTEDRYLRISKVHESIADIKSKHDQDVQNGLALDMVYTAKYPLICEITLMQPDDDTIMAGMNIWVNKVNDVLCYSYSGFGIIEDIITEARMMVDRIR